MRTPIAVCGVALLLACRTTPDVRYVYPDLRPILDSSLDTRGPMARHFPEFLVVPLGRSRPEDRATERISGSVFPGEGEPWPWRISLMIDVYPDAAAAGAARSRDCAASNRQQYDPAATRFETGPSGSWCASPFEEMLDGPGGYCLPSGRYDFFVHVQKDRLLISLAGTSENPVPLDPLIEDVARRLEGKNTRFVYKREAWESEGE
jgi:hypothetical protein